MAWIESHTVLIRHRKVVELARELRLRKAYVIGHLHALWHAALEQQEDGNLSQWSDELIAEYSDFNGDAPQYVRLLQKYGFLDGKIIHDWIDYAGMYLTKKYSTNDVEWLMEIWAKHGKEYGQASKKRAKSEPTLPNHTLPNLTNQRKKESKERKVFQKHPFELSPFSEFQKFKEALPDWPESLAMEYYERAKGYSGANGGKYLNWILAVKNWKRSDDEKCKGNFAKGRAGAISAERHAGIEWKKPE